MAEAKYERMAIEYFHHRRKNEMAKAKSYERMLVDFFGPFSGAYVERTPTGYGIKVSDGEGSVIDVSLAGLAELIAIHGVDDDLPFGDDDQRSVVCD